MIGDKGENITISKDMLYGIIVALLAGLLVLSVFTQGFGIANIVKSPTAVAPAQPSAPAQPTSAQPSIPTGVSGSVNMVTLMDDDMKIGSDSAPVVIIEFSDFQCPFCRKFWMESFPSIKKDYIDTGKVQMVYRDFPLSFHPAAQPAAEATECAADQNKGWEMHDKIFQEQSKLGQGTVQFTKDDIKKWATEISGLNAATFNNCLDLGKYTQEVAKDLNDGVATGISGTPGFVIGKRDGSRVVPINGAQPYSIFKSAIDQLLQ